MKRHTAVSLAATFTLLCCSILPVGAYDMGSPEEPLRLSAGLSHTVYVDETGTLWAWGSNQASQLGTETQETGTDLEGNPIPYASQPLAVMEDVVSASAGADFTVALKADGTLWTWGGNDEGQLGTGTTEGSATPVQVLDQVTAVVAGDYHVAALRTDGTLWTWGGQPLRPAGGRHLHQPLYPGPGDGGGHHRGRRGGGHRRHPHRQHPVDLGG